MCVFVCERERERSTQGTGGGSSTCFAGTLSFLFFRCSTTSFPAALSVLSLRAAPAGRVPCHVSRQEPSQQDKNTHVPDAVCAYGKDRETGRNKQV